MVVYVFSMVFYGFSMVVYGFSMGFYGFSMVFYRFSTAHDGHVAPFIGIEPGAIEARHRQALRSPQAPRNGWPGGNLSFYHGEN